MQVEGQTDAELVFLLAHDSDPFCRWEAGQTLLRALLTKLYHAARDQKVGATAVMPHHSALLLPYSPIPFECWTRCRSQHMQPDAIPVLKHVKMMLMICGMCDVTSLKRPSKLQGGLALLRL